MKLSREEVRHVALLSRMGLSEVEVERFREQLSNILENFEILKQVETTGVTPTSHPLVLQNVVREDGAVPSLPREEILANAPQRQDDCFKVKAVLE